MSTLPSPIDIRLHTQSSTLELFYTDSSFELSAEFLRVHSPSAEVRGHGVGQATLQTGKKFVRINQIELSGRYALKITFSDGHDSGLYTWAYLYDLAHNQQQYWETYLQKLSAAGASRDDGLLARH